MEIEVSTTEYLCSVKVINPGGKGGPCDICFTVTFHVH